MAATTRSRSRAKQTPKDAAEAVTETAKAVDAQEQQSLPDGVFVIKVTDEQGNIGIDAQPTGNVQATEVLTILELAQNTFRAKIGLTGQAGR